MYRSEDLKVLLSTNGKAPYDETSVADVLSTFNAAVLGQLLSVDKNFELLPGLIEHWSWDYEQQFYSLTLRRGISFHNGRIAKAQDLEFSLLRGFFSDKRSFYSVYLSDVVGIEAVSGALFESGVVSGIKIIDDYSVQIRLKSPNPNFLYALTNPYFSLVPKEELNPDHLTWRSVPIGAGPYQVTRAFSDGEMTLKSVGAAHPSTIQLFTKDKLDVYDIALSEPSRKDKYSTTKSDYPASVWSIFFSNANELSTNRWFRKALDTGIDRNELAAVASVPPAYELLPRHFWGRYHAASKFDRELAKSFFLKVPPRLRERNWKIPVFSSGTFSIDRSRRLANLQTQLKEIGLIVEFYPSSEKFLSSKTAVESPLKISGRVTDFIDPLIMFASFRGNSPYKFERPKSDDAFELAFLKSKAAKSRQEKVESVVELSKYCSEQALVVPLLEDPQVYYVNDSTVESLGEQPQAMTLFFDRITQRSSR